MDEEFRLWTKKDWREVRTLHTKTMRLLSGTIEPALALRPNDIESKAAQARCTEVLESLEAAIAIQEEMLRERGLTGPPDDPPA
ncbi:hypothetical protein [Arthrobacter sp. S2(2024)]|uniref:hypothetical protein n=1 Tax=Arthrobacter sp. S2(2024) TaxID=3111911 RepID=UPI002FC700F3